VNFWRPGGGTFAAVAPGEPFFFKLKAPHDAIGGFGQFARFARLPLWMAWDVFGQANGAQDVKELRTRLARLSRSTTASFDMDHRVGCISIAFPTFFAPDEWVSLPTDWKRNIVSGRTYDLTSGYGRRLWDECVERAAATRELDDWTAEAEEKFATGSRTSSDHDWGKGASGSR
jgi:putative restriction endonuclease